MGNNQVIAPYTLKSSRKIFSTALWLLLLATTLGCLPLGQRAAAPEMADRLRLRPIDIDPVSAGKIGREALEKIGYDQIIELSRKANFIEYKEIAKNEAGSAIQLVSYGDVTAAVFLPVFSRYAAAAAVTAQADSPLPGPADIAAVGVLVVGLIDAGLLDGYLLKTAGEVLFASGDTAVTTQAAAQVAEEAAVPKGGTQEADIDPNKLRHIFDKEEHALDDFVKSQGGPAPALRAIQKAANQALREGRIIPGPNGVLPGGDAGPIIQVGDTPIRLIGGRVVNGIVQIASASRKGLK